MPLKGLHQFEYEKRKAPETSKLCSESVGVMPKIKCRSSPWPVGEAEAPPLAMGMTCGFILGMTPSLSLHSLLIFLILFFFRIQIGAALITAFFFKFVAFLLDPVFHSVGSKVLEIESLQRHLYHLSTTCPSFLLPDLIILSSWDRPSLLLLFHRLFFS